MRDMEDVLLWSDGTWCYRHELLEYGWMSDDYTVLEYGTQRWDKFLMDNEYVEYRKDK